MAAIEPLPPGALAALESEIAWLQSRCGQEPRIGGDLLGLRAARAGLAHLGHCAPGPDDAADLAACHHGRALKVLQVQQARLRAKAGALHHRWRLWLALSVALHGADSLFAPAPPEPAPPKRQRRRPKAARRTASHGTGAAHA